MIVRARRRRADHGDAGVERAAAELDEQLGDPVGGGLRQLGSTPRSKRLDASEGSLWRLPVRNDRRPASKCAASITTAVVVADISVVSPPITPARPIGPGVVGDQQVLGDERAVDAVEGGQLLAPARPAHADRARRACRAS